MSKYHKLFLFVMALVIAATVVVYQVPLVRGLDLDGGVRVVLKADPRRSDDWPKEPSKRNEKMQTIRKTIMDRVKGMQGVAEPKVVIQDSDKVVVELPGVKDQEEALNRIRSTASLEFYYLKNVQTSNNPTAKWRMEVADDGAYVFTGPGGKTIDSKKNPEAVLDEVVNADVVEPILTGEYLIANAKANLNQRQQPVVEIEFNKEGSKIFAQFTRSHIDDILAVFFDGKLVTAPTINEPIPNGKAEISGFNSVPEAKEMADLLNAGALPIPLKVIAQDKVEPTLGAETIEQVLKAGITGLILVALFMLIYYRLPGLLADIALVLYALFVIAAFKLIGATMSLAGVAALIISIGMAVDANILIFERLKEELRSGKTLRAAIDAGFSRAFTAIFDSNVCTAITCAILMWYGTPAVQSFAFTLLIGVAISMFTAITVTRTILHLLVSLEWAQKPKLFGLGTSWFSNASLSMNIIGKRAAYFVFSIILVIIGGVALFMWGLKPGIEFQSGTSIQVSFKEPVQLAEVHDVVGKYTKQYEVQLAKANDATQPKTMAFVKTNFDPEADENYEQKMDNLLKDLDSEFGIRRVDDAGNPVFDAVNTVGPTVSEELTTNAFWSVVFASAAIVLYLAFRFAIGGLTAGFKFGVCAVIALIHDTIFLLGLFAALGKFYGWEIDTMFVTAVLTVIGYSVHDSIVIFDRIRENLRHRLRGENFEQLTNRSVLQTFSRSINTSVTVMLTLGTLIVFGGPLLRHFYVAMLAGVVVGTYSSIFLASPLLVVWENIGLRRSGGKKKDTAAEKSLVDTPAPTAFDPGVPASTDTAASTPEVESGNGKSQESQPGRAKRKKQSRKRS